MFIVGFRRLALEKHTKDKRLVLSFMNKPPPKMPRGKVWKPKCGNLPLLSSYKRTLPASYWSNWNKRTFAQVLPTKFWVSSSEVVYKDIARLKRVVDRLDNGANIGCEGRGRLPTVTPNGSSAYELGARVADSLQDWINQGIGVGPLKKRKCLGKI